MPTSKESDCYSTPPEFWKVLDEEFHFTRGPDGKPYDPVPREPEGLRDGDGGGETPAWVRCYFMNPPYSDVEPWLKKAFFDYSRGIQVVVLLKDDRSTLWFARWVWPYAEPRPVLANVERGTSGRIKFNGVSGGNFASMVAVYTPGVVPARGRAYVL